MPHASTLDEVRRLVHKAFAELGASQELPTSEHILIRNNLYCGRRFCCGAFEAVWFIEEDEIKIHDSDGAVVRVLPGSQIAVTHQRRAA